MVMVLNTLYDTMDGKKNNQYAIIKVNQFMNTCVFYELKMQCVPERNSQSGYEFKLQKKNFSYTFGFGA